MALLVLIGNHDHYDHHTAGCHFKWTSTEKLVLNSRLHSEVTAFYKRIKAHYRSPHHVTWHVELISYYPVKASDCDSVSE